MTFVIPTSFAAAIAPNSTRNNTSHTTSHTTMHITTHKATFTTTDLRASSSRRKNLEYSEIRANMPPKCGNRMWLFAVIAAGNDRVATSLPRGGSHFAVAGGKLNLIRTRTPSRRPIMADSPGADRNLLFGVLALQMNFIGRDALIAGMNAWVQQKTRPLGQILLDQGQLSDAQVRGLDQIIALHLKAHGDDPQRSLKAISVASSEPVAPLFGSVTDPELQASIMTVASGERSDGTTAYAPPSHDGTRYKVLRPHAKGGLGEVFVAEDMELHREVALKEIQAHKADDAASRARFILEAEVTGGLEHPGVVPVYGLGVYDDGRPYYAMRFIRGESLKAAIDRFHRESTLWSTSERRLALRELLTRFVAVCNAVAYAHSRGVLHRDLKPANVMLGKFGETLVVDWGLAKPGAGKGGDSSIPKYDEPTLLPSSGSHVDGTRAGSRMGTAQYMSPEQDAGRVAELGPTSDIYSLGVSLYVLLTGRRPFDDVPADDLPEAVQSGRFPPPRRLKPEAPPALEAICLKAMALRLVHRYQSALDLAADVEHWLADEPVSAYAEPLPARAARWARRHRTAVASAGVLLLTAVVALSLTTLLVWREERKTEAQRRIAQDNYALARDLSVNSVDLIVRDEAEFASSPSTHKLRKKILTSGSSTYRRYLDEQPDDPAMRERVAMVFRFTANVHRLEHEVAAAESLYRDSIALYQKLAEQFPDEPAHREGLSGVLRDQASLLSNTGRLGDAAKALGRAVELARELREKDAQRPEWRRTLAAALLNRASVESTRGDHQTAEASAAESAELFRGLADSPALGAYDRLLEAAARNIIAKSRRDNPSIDPSVRDTAMRLQQLFGGTREAVTEAVRINRARRAHTEAMEAVDKVIKGPPRGMNLNDAIHFRTLFVIEQAKTLARVSVKRAADADRNLGLAAGELEGLMTRFGEVPMYRTGLARALQERGELRTRGGRAGEARADFERVIKLVEKQAAEAPPPPGATTLLGRAQLGLGRLDRASGDVDNAKKAFAAANAALQRATTLSPEDAEDRRWLNELLGELK
jgi:serine/threonine protein kinase